MASNSKDLIEISIDRLFDNSAQYLIPIYQRNYAWDNVEREQLLEDIIDVMNTEEQYFLGSLIVYEKDENVYEVIDGQQRLTTLFIMLVALGERQHAHNLRFEARDKANNTLEKLAEGQLEAVDKQFHSMELYNAWKQFKQFSENFTKINQIKNKLKQIKLLRITVPKDTDLNHYFEIMNTRGEQLEAHEILKARLMSHITDGDIHGKRNVFSTVWDACSNMNRYVQMSFDPPERRNIFGRDLEHLKISNFSELVKAFMTSEYEEADGFSQTMSVMDAIKSYNKIEVVHIDEPKEAEEDNRFESIISFPNFLLHVLKLYKGKQFQDEDSTLNDNKLLDLFSDDVQPEAFIYTLLETRFLFDKSIIKREYYHDYKREGSWSLQKLKSYEKNQNYVNTYGGQAKQETKTYKKIRTLQSMLRITYTSPKTMHWITHSLAFLKNNKNEKDISNNYLLVLENYARKKVNENINKYNDSIRLERIVFTYLDYLLWRDGYENVINQVEDYEFTFRNSIEHFYPQNPDLHEGYERLESSTLNHFGNLCLITVSDNSKFSNQIPEAKITNRQTIKSSQKLRIMATITENTQHDWSAQSIKWHGKRMLEILNKDLKYMNSVES